MNIYQRINAVMQNVEYVQKDAVVQGYKAVTHDQVVSVARAELVKNGIVIYPYQRDGEIIIKRGDDGAKQHLYSANYAVNFVNIDEPRDRIVVQVQAHAADTSDKAPGKAASYATKTAILKVLCLETGENDESRTEARKTIDGDKVSEINSLIGQTETDINGLLGHFKVSALDELTEVQYTQAVAILRKKIGGDSGDS